MDIFGRTDVVESFWFYLYLYKHLKKIPIIQPKKLSEICCLFGVFLFFCWGYVWFFRLLFILFLFSVWWVLFFFKIQTFAKWWTIYNKLKSFNKTSLANNKKKIKEKLNQLQTSCYNWEEIEVESSNRNVPHHYTREIHTTFRSEGKILILWGKTFNIDL